MSSVFIYVYPISLNYFKIFSREIQAIIRPHTNSHTIPRFTTKCHIKRKNEARHKSWGGNYGPDDAITNKICHLLLEKYNQQNASTHKKALAKIRSRALPTVFLPRTFYKNSALSRLMQEG